MSLRIGQGLDAHPLVAGRRCVLGGVEIPSDAGPEGHSDGDVVLHALADVRYRGGVHVELSRHSHEAPTVARRAFDFLQPLMPES